MRIVLLFVLVSLPAWGAYEGSTFTEVRDVLFDKYADPQTPEHQAELATYRAGKLPKYQLTAASFVRYGVDLLKQAARRTLSDKVDYYPRLTKLLHPNGVCFTGSWEITEPSEYTGYFSQGAKALFVGRTSVAMTETEAGHKRGFGFAGKLFPTTNRDERVKTANFFTVDVLMGTKLAHFVETALTNEPATGFDLFSIPLGLKILHKLKDVEPNPGYRPVTPIARLGGVEKPKAPRWMRIRPEAGATRVNEKDFRRELDIGRSFPNGLRMEIAVSDKSGEAAAKTWRTIGYIQLKESVVSYGCDRQLHFAHPRLND